MNDFWKHSKWFKTDDFPYRDMSHPWIINVMDKIRDMIGPITINRAFDPRAMDGSQHRMYPCYAVDFSAKSDLTLFEQFIEISRMTDITAIGVYPHWNTPGFHVDLRVSTSRKYWYHDGNQYRAITEYFKG